MERKLLPETPTKVGFILERPCKTIHPDFKGRIKHLPMELWIHWPPVASQDYGYDHCAGEKTAIMDAESSEKMREIFKKADNYRNYVLCTCQGHIVE